MTKRCNVFIINSCFSRNFTQAMLTLDTAYSKIPKICPSMYKPPKLVTQKSSVKPTPPPPLNQYKPQGACTWELPSNKKKKKKKKKEKR